MSEYDDWTRDNFYAPYDVPTPEQAFEAGCQLQQGEVDKLQTDIDELNEVVNGWKDEYKIMTLRYERSKKQIDELQARVDGAMKILLAMKHNGTYKAIDILTGVGQ